MYEDLKNEVRKKWNQYDLDGSIVTSKLRVIDINSDRAIILSDFHIPYHRNDIIEKILFVYGGRGYDLYINGDLLDMECMSGFPRFSNITLEQEYNIALDILNKFKDKFEKIYLLEGNHERRLRRSLMRLNSFVEMSFIFNPDILEYLSMGYKFERSKIVEEYDFSNVHNIGSFMVKVGDDLVMMHPNNYRSTPGGTVKLAIEYVLQYDKSIKHVIIGHTHKIAQINHLGVYGYEQGCLTKPLGYESNGQITLKGTQLGFAEVYFKGNSVNEIYIMNLSR